MLTIILPDGVNGYLKASRDGRSFFSLTMSRTKQMHRRASFKTIYIVRRTDSVNHSNSSMNLIFTGRHSSPWCRTVNYYLSKTENFLFRNWSGKRCYKTNMYHEVTYWTHLVH